MHNIHNGKSPRYLCEIVQSTFARTTRYNLRSCSAATTYVTPWLRTKFRERAFSFTCPTSWNLLSIDLHSVSDNTIFKKQLKSYLFRLALDI